jgi:hypothetical protein
MFKLAKHKKCDHSGLYDTAIWERAGMLTTEIPVSISLYVHTQPCTNTSEFPKVTPQHNKHNTNVQYSVALDERSMNREKSR